MFAETGYPLGLTPFALVAIIVACWTSATGLTVWLWWASRQRHWEGRWIDGPDIDRRRVCLDADRVRGAVVYRHFNTDGTEVYAGQTGKRRHWWQPTKPHAFAERMRNEGSQIMAQQFATWHADSVPRFALDDVERWRIGLARIRNPRLLNRTAGNGGRWGRRHG